MRSALVRLCLFTALAGLAVAVLPGANPALAKDDLDVIRERGVVRLAQSHSPPNTIKDVKTGEWSGSYIDLVKSIFEPIGVEVEAVDTPWGSMAAALQSGTVDLAPLTIRGRPAMVLDYSDPILLMPLTVLLPDDADSGLDTGAALNDPSYRLAVMEGSVHAALAEPILPDATLVSVTDHNDAILALETGRADAVISHYTAVVNYVKRRDQGRAVIPEPVVGLVNALTFRPGNPALKRFLNASILASRVGGGMRAIFERYGTAQFIFE